MAHIPSARGRMLGAELRRLRDERGKRLRGGLTKKAVAIHMGRSESWVYRAEAGKTPIAWAEVAALCDFYEAPADEKDRLVNLARNAEQQDWWTDFSDVFTGSYVSFEAVASWMRTYHAGLVPGVLQAPPYADAVIRKFRADASDEEVRRRVEARMARQTILDGGELTDLSALLDEAVIRRCMAADASVARAQISALLDAADRPNVAIRIVPFDAGFHDCISEGSFVRLGFNDPTYPSLVYAEGLMGDVYVEKEEGVSRYEIAWDRTAALAMSADESAEYLRASWKGLK
ncbi:helix-turn-helix domain-containing protein [Streptomyces cupreus]|uniref:Helix-turn-helix domain-containing protein n=1 Tax=Streptomyces cupreus TaxID=2759956 RepID=A0A7X1J1C4_9ACTN|nr:helix-turn-helix transcriptional regulator [Streptomyces cupreus]MBC2902403.1 helix-turn-helix domain-containing protein [Streptomyces cupreus]